MVVPVLTSSAAADLNREVETERDRNRSVWTLELGSAGELNAVAWR